jgi:hypothetical protein
MKACCKTCPFKLDKHGRQQDAKLANEVTGRTLLKGHQICHGTEDEGTRKPRNRCKGSFDSNMEIYKRLGMDHLVAK